MAKNIFKLCLRILIIASVVAGICLTPQNRMHEQFWYFTIQTNIFIAVLEIILVGCQILSMCGEKLPFLESKGFSFIRTLATFFITITGVIYCFVLAPAGMHFDKKPLSVLFDLRNVLLHITVPVMSIIDHLFHCPKGNLKYKHAPFFLIYPLFYFALVNIRAIFSTKRFIDGSLYPYFFLDPYLDGQGWGMVAIYLTVICLIFVGLAMLYIFLDKKLAKRKNKKS